MDRIFGGLNFVEKNPTNSVTWFLSGGIKRESGTYCEADIMYNELKLYNKSWSYIIDRSSTNTAENLYTLSHLKNNSLTDERVFIVTSRFHYYRANEILKRIDDTLDVTWILTAASFENADYMETVYLENIEEDTKINIKRINLEYI